MDIKELDKKQLILLTLLITFVVSIATGIVTVSLMNQMPKSVPQTINNVIQRTIEKVTTVQAPAQSGNDKKVDSTETSQDKPVSFLGTNDALVSIYLDNVSNTATPQTGANESVPNEPVALGQGIIISDEGLILVDSSLINDKDSYKVILNKTDFSASLLKKFNNGFTILKIAEKKSVVETPEGIDTDTATTKITQ